MVYVIMHGRLGNQMFQYAFAKKIQKSREDQLSLYFGKVNKANGESGWSDDLRYFNVDEYKTVDSITFLFWKTSIKQKVLLLSYHMKCRRIHQLEELEKYQESMQPKLNKAGLYWIRNGVFEPMPTNAKNIFISGHFEYAPLYEGMEEYLKNQFAPKKELLAQNEELMSLITNTESVCVSIRRGDFLSSNNRETYFLCDEQYFDKAIEVIRERIPNSTLFFFSDDVEWIKNNCKYDGSVYFETEGNPVWEKMRLMSSCKHFVISNSTFSWWAQYLSDNKNKVVVSPNRWKNNSNYKGLISDSFIKIEV